jgi:hypothetical protein
MAASNSLARRFVHVDQRDRLGSAGRLAITFLGEDAADDVGGARVGGLAVPDFL